MQAQTLVLFFLLTGSCAHAQEFPPKLDGVGRRVQQADRSIGVTPEHVARLRVVVDVFVSDDGKNVAFTRAEPRLHGDEPGAARTHLYLLDGKTEKLLVGGKESVQDVAWRPATSMLTFCAKKEGDAHDEVYGLDPATGVATRITQTPHGVGSYEWRADGQALAYTVLDPLDETDAGARAMGFEQTVRDEDFRHVSLWLWEQDGGRNHRVTSDCTVGSFHWNPQGTALAAAIAPRNLVDDAYMFQRLHVIDAGSSKVLEIVDNPGKLGEFAWSADGAKLAYIAAVDRNDPHAGMVHVADVASGAARCLDPRFDGMVHHVAWNGNDRLRAVVSKGVTTWMATIAVADGSVTLDEHGSGPVFLGFEGDYVVGSTAQHPEELMRYDGQRFERLTDSNPWLAEQTLAEQEVVRFAARDGLQIEGVLMHPHPYFLQKDCPLVIVVHGGPEAHHSNGWLTSYGNWGQMLAARGCYVWFPNYRASTGYGVAFTKLDHGDPMGREFEDHLDAIAHFAKQGLIDPSRVGIGGGSYGGYTAAWAATRHSEHFAAAVSFVPFVDIRSKWMTSDIPWEFYYVHYQEKWPHQQLDLLADRSPLTWAHQCRTPLLVLGGTSDPRVHPSQPFMLYSAVKFTTKTPVRYVQYPGEGHGNRSNVYRYDYCVRTLRWFDHYLRAGDHRSDAPPPYRVDYSAWQSLER